MGQAKLAVQVGQISFSGEGSEEWIGQQLDYFLSKLPQLSGAIPVAEAEPVAKQAAEPINVGSLASYIKQKGGERNQVKRFLITANWLRLRGDNDLKTASIGKALQDNQQKKLSNPSLCLSRNIGQGYCEKAGNGFYITPEGLQSLGEAADQVATPNNEEADETGSATSNDIVGTRAKKKRAVRQPPPGSSCRDRIKVLKSKGFFKTAKTTTDIVTGLGKEGWTHNSPQVGAALSIMFDKGEIQRTKDGGSFKYYWDRD